ncbi:MAG: alpha/beta fold hydrolase, partial [Pseudomonadota bacterium]
RSFLHQKDAASDEMVALLREPFRVLNATDGLAHWLPTLLTPPKGALSMDRAQYANISLPTGIIWGREDQATPLTQGQELNALIPGSQLTVLDEIGHIPQIEDPEGFQRALIAVLGSI